MPGTPGRRFLLGATAVGTMCLLASRARQAGLTPAVVEQPEPPAPAQAPPAGAATPRESARAATQHSRQRQAPRHLAPVASRRASYVALAAGAAVLLVSVPGLAQQAAALSSAPTGAATIRTSAPAVSASLTQPAWLTSLVGRPRATRSTAAPQPAQAAPPKRLLIAALGLDSPLMPLGLRPNGSLQAPPDFDVPGWFEGGPRPGEPGAALIVGHVDSTKGPAVFYRLERLRPGDVIVVGRQDGTSARFQVDRLESFRKDSFPTSHVFGGVRDPELRLIGRVRSSV